MSRLMPLLLFVILFVTAPTVYASVPETKKYYSIQCTALPMVQRELGTSTYNRLKAKGYMVYHALAKVDGVWWMRLKIGVFPTITSAREFGSEFRRQEGYDFFIANADVRVLALGAGQKIITTPNAVWMEKNDQNLELLVFNAEPLEAADVLARVRTAVSPDGTHVVCEYGSQKYTMPIKDTRVKDEDLEKAKGLIKDTPITNENIEKAKNLVARGTKYLAAGSTDLAIADFNSALSIQPGLAEAYCNRGDAFQQKEQYDQAIIDYSRCLERNTENAAAYYKQGMSYYKQENLDQATKKFSKALFLDPQYTTAYYYRGITHYRQGNYDQAIADCTSTLKIDPRHSDAYSIRALVWLEKGDHDRAIKDCDKALAINPQDIAAYSTLGVAWLQKGEVEWACSDLQKACDLGRCETLETVKKQGYCK